MELPVKSATYAMKGRQLLRANGIRASVGKSSGRGGCYYYLKVSERDLLPARKILSENGVLR